MKNGIVFESITKDFPIPGESEPSHILKGISGRIDPGDFLTITGRSGSGKSTLLYILSTLDPFTTGRLTLNGVDVLQLNERELHEFRNQSMGFVFQFHYLLPELSTLENVLMPARKLKLHHQLKPYALELIELFGLSHRAHQLSQHLSGGEQQRVAIARALIMKPQFIFADEPTGNLDSSNGLAVMELLKKLNQTLGTTVIFVTHDVEFASMASRKIHLVDGRIAEQETSKN